MNIKNTKHLLEKDLMIIECKIKYQCKDHLKWELPMMNRISKSVLQTSLSKLILNSKT